MKDMDLFLWNTSCGPPLIQLRNHNGSSMVPNYQAQEAHWSIVTIKFTSVKHGMKSVSNLSLQYCKIGSIDIF